MDIFKVHGQLIDDYKSFTTSSVTPLDARIAQHVHDELAEGKQWPEPWLSLNPTFATGGSIDDLVNEGLLHPECAKIFWPKIHIADAGVRSITLHVVPSSSACTGARAPRPRLWRRSWSAWRYGSCCS